MPKFIKPTALALFTGLMCIPAILKAQDEYPITTAVPFLLIGPDARSGSMGETGVATDPDPVSIHWNAAKYAFIDKQMGFSVSYSPWLRQLVNDIGLGYLTFYYRFDDKQEIGRAHV